MFIRRHLFVVLMLCMLTFWSDVCSVGKVQTTVFWLFTSVDVRFSVLWSLSPLAFDKLLLSSGRKLRHVTT